MNNETITYKFINCRNITISIFTTLCKEDLTNSSNFADYNFEKKQESKCQENELSYKEFKKKVINL